jgi:hypothetical protein
MFRYCFLKDKERQRCILCCTFCFTPGTLTKGPKVIQRNEFHKNVKMTSKDAIRFDSGRQGHMADARCSICKVPLCFKKPRFPGRTKSCWDIFHIQADLWYGECTTLYHVGNPQRELDIDCTEKAPQITNAVVDYSNRKKRKVQKPTGYGGHVLARREQTSERRTRETIAGTGIITHSDQQK